MRPTLSGKQWHMFFMPIFILLCALSANATTILGRTTISDAASNFAGWNRKQPITIDHNQVAGASDLIDFPFLVTLDHLDEEVVDGGAYSALNGGGDLRFSMDSNGNNRLAIEVVEFVTSVTRAIDNVRYG